MEIRYIPTPLEGVTIIEAPLAGDNRGSYCRLLDMDEFRDRVAEVDFVLENESMSYYGVIRGLHCQLPPYAQGKLVRALTGKILDVAVDIRQGSPSFGRHLAVELSEMNRRMLYIPRGFAHGFSVLSPSARVCFKCDNVFSADSETGFRFDDPDLGIDWGIPAERVIVSAKDEGLPSFRAARLFG